MYKTNECNCIKFSNYKQLVIMMMGGWSNVGHCSERNVNNVFVKTVLKHTFFKRSWHH